MESIRVVVADDHEMMRNGLEVFFQAYDDLELVGQATNGLETVAVCAHVQPNVLLIELGFKQPDSLETIHKVQKLCPDISMIALASLGEETLGAAALDAGAFCCLLKDVPIEALAEAIREAYACSFGWG